jgi:hypothetical protein
MARSSAPLFWGVLGIAVSLSLHAQAQPVFMASAKSVSRVPLISKHLPVVIPDRAFEQLRGHQDQFTYREHGSDIVISKTGLLFKNGRTEVEMIMDNVRPDTRFLPEAAPIARCGTQNNPHIRA